VWFYVSSPCLFSFLRSRRLPVRLVDIVNPHGGGSWRRYLYASTVWTSPYPYSSSKPFLPRSFAVSTMASRTWPLAHPGLAAHIFAIAALTCGALIRFPSGTRN